MTLHMIRDWKYLAMSTKIIDKYQGSSYLEKIINKFEDSRIQTETLNNSSLFSFRIGRKERVICKPSHYQDQNCLVIIDILENHEYDQLKRRNNYSDLTSDTIKIIAVSQEILTNNIDVPKSYYTLPKLASTNCFNKTIILSSNQLKILESITSNANIFKINGAAGSGKTLLAELLLCNAFIDNDESNLLYITKSQKLVSETINHIDHLLSDNPTRTNCSNMVLKTYDDFCKDLGFSNTRSNFEDFITWIRDKQEFVKYIRRLQGKKQNNAYTIAKEIYEDIRKIHDNAGSIGKKQSYNHNISKNVLNLYQEYLKYSNKINLSLITVDDNYIVNRSYDYIIVDETQDFGKSELELIFSCLRQNTNTKKTIGSIYFFIDPNQSLMDDFNITSGYINNLSIYKKMTLSEYNLTYNYRNPQLINALANHIMKMKSIMLGGVISKDSHLDIKTINDDSLLSEDNTGCITWVNTNKDNTKASDSNDQRVLDKLNQESKHSLELAVIMPDNTFLDAAKTLFPDGLIFTPKEIKGLECKKVVLFNFISGKYYNNIITYKDINYINEYIHKKENKNFPKTIQEVQAKAKYSQFFNNLFVAITRTTNSLYFIETEEDKSQAFEKLINCYRSTVADIDLEQLSLSDLLIQFKNISKKELSSDIIQKFCNKIHNNIKLSRMNPEEKTHCIDELKDILKNIKGLESITINHLITTLEKIPVKNTTIVNDENISTSTTTSPSRSQSAQVNYTKKINSKNKCSSIAAENTSLTKPTNSVHNILQMDIESLICYQQLECICDDYNQSTTLCILTQIPPAQTKLLKYIKENGHKLFSTNISDKALNYCNGQNISALYNLLSNKNLNTLFNLLIKDEDFVKKITVEGLSRVGPNGYAPIHLISKKTDTLNKHIKNLCKRQKILQKLKNIQYIEDLSPLHVVAGNGNIEVMKLLIDQGAQVDAKKNEGHTPLHVAADNGNVEVMKLLIDQGAQVDAQNNEGHTPLHVAVAKGNIEAIKSLVEKGAQVDAKDNAGCTPLHYAAGNGNIEVMKLLIDQGAQVDAKNNEGHTPLHYAAGNGNIEVMKLLIDQGAQVDAKNNEGHTPLHYAAGNENIEVMKLLIDQGAQVDAKNNEDLSPLHVAVAKENVEAIKFLVAAKGAQVDAQNNEGHTPLHAASGNGNVEAIKFLIEKGAQVDAKDNAGRIPLYFAVQCEQLEAIKFLVAKGAQVDAQNNEGHTPLHAASGNGNVEAIKFLIEKGAQVDAKDNAGRIPLYFAVQCEQLEAIKFLVAKGAQVDAQNNEGHTPLHAASGNGNVEAIKFLIEKGAQVDAKDNAGRIPLYFAVQCEQLEAIKFLVAKGAQVDAQNNEGCTPLHVAVAKGNVNAIKFLVEAKGAQVDAQNNEGHTPLHYAAAKRNVEAIKFLVEAKGAQVDAQNNEGCTPLHVASGNGNVEAIKSLVAKGAQVDAKNNAGCTPLHYAAAKRNVEAIKFLVEAKGVQVDAQNNEGRTPLHYAAAKGNVEAIKFLVEKGAQVDAQNNEGRTPLHYAAAKGNVEAIKSLVKKGAAIDAKDNEGRTPLYLAVQYEQLEAIKSLVEKGAQVDAKDNKGRTPLYLAVQYEQLEAIKFLVEEKGLQVDAKDNASHTFLKYAAENRNNKSYESLKLS